MTPSGVSVATTIVLGDGAGAGDFYSDSGCGTPLAGSADARQIALASSAYDSGIFYYKSATSGAVTITARKQGGGFGGGPGGPGR